MNDNMPIVVPNFLPFNQNSLYNNEEIKRSLDRIIHDLEIIENKLSQIENKIDNKSNTYLTSDVSTGKGLYMI